MGYCYYWKIGKKRKTVISENRQETGYCYYWNTVDANVCDILIGLLLDTVMFSKKGKKRDTVLLENRQETGYCIIGK